VKLQAVGIALLGLALGGCPTADIPCNVKAGQTVKVTVSSLTATVDDLNDLKEIVDVITDYCRAKYGKDKKP